jgi:hypothetical protein
MSVKGSLHLWCSARYGGRPWNTCEGEHPFSASSRSSSGVHNLSLVTMDDKVCLVMTTTRGYTHRHTIRSLLINPCSFMSRPMFSWGKCCWFFYSATSVSVDFEGIVRCLVELARGRSGPVIIFLKWVKDVQRWLYIFKGMCFSEDASAAFLFTHHSVANHWFLTGCRWWVLTFLVLLILSDWWVHDNFWSYWFRLRDNQIKRQLTPN